MADNHNKSLRLKNSDTACSGHSNHGLEHDPHTGHSHDVEHDHSFRGELLHHLPYAIFSLSLAMVILSLLDYTSGVTRLSIAQKALSCKAYHTLFHSFHFMHILFASTGAVITFSKYSRNLVKTLLVGTISPAFFCVLSDILLPYLAGIILGVPMAFHVCWYSEINNVLPFLAVGVINGLVLRSHHTAMLANFSVSSHFIHILISSLASLFYMVSNGFFNWEPQMGVIFLFLAVAIVVPCTLSDVVVPMYFAGVNKRKKA